MPTVREQATAAASAYRRFLETGTTARKNAVLWSLAALLRSRADAILAANARDMESAQKLNLAKALLDRLALSTKRIEDMARSCEEVAGLPDPVGRIENMTVRPPGFKVGKMRTPIGVIAIIYEARPNVTIEAASLTMKSGNAAILRGGTAAYHSNRTLTALVSESLTEHGIEPGLVTYIESMERSAVDELVILDDLVHLVIPRGGESLIRSVVEKSRIPVLKHYKGVCHVYVHEAADPDMALRIILNAKVQRPAVCNAAETLLVDKSVATSFLPKTIAALRERGVEIRGCEKTRAIVPDLLPATVDDWTTEYLDLILSVRVVDGLDQAVDHINRYGSAHTDAIVTSDLRAAEQFVSRVDSASVMVNASTRLADGGVYGLGAEIGISTDRLHARGPMGLEELTTTKWVVLGDGHIRE